MDQVPALRVATVHQAADHRDETDLHPDARQDEMVRLQAVHPDATARQAAALRDAMDRHSRRVHAAMDPHREVRAQEADVRHLAARPAANAHKPGEISTRRDSRQPLE